MIEEVVGLFMRHLNSDARHQVQFGARVTFRFNIADRLFEIGYISGKL